MTKTSTMTRSRLIVCLVVLAVVFATFLAGTFTTDAASDGTQPGIFQKIELKVGDKLGFVYYTTQPYTDKTTMRFEINGRVQEVNAINNNKQCVFVFDDIYPHELCEEIKATIRVNGTAIISKNGLSVQSFLLDMLQDRSQTANVHKFASNLLQYGEMTRQYRDIFVADTPKESILDFDENIYSNYNPDDIYETEFPSTTNTLGLSSHPSIRMSSIGVAYYNVNNYVIKLEIPNSSSLNSVKVKINGKEYTSNSFTSTNETGVYEVRSEPIHAYDILKPINVELSVAGKVVQSATYSVSDYISQLQEVVANEDPALLYAKSLYYYGKYASNTYKKTVIAMSLVSNPSNITLANTNSQTPSGGAVTLYYSDGTTAEIAPSWSTVTGIADKTYTVTRDTVGSFTDNASGKTYKVDATVTLLNPLSSVERWKDPKVYSPTSHQDSYTPTDAQLRATWSNGYKEIVTGTCTSVNFSGRKLTEYENIKVSASYTCSNSHITKSADVYLRYENPIAKITVKNTSMTFAKPANGSTLTPNHTTYTITFKNGQTTAEFSTNGGGAAYGTFTLQTASYTGTDESGTVKGKGTLTAKAYGSWTYYTGGTGSTAGTTAWDVKARTIEDEMDVTFSNPEYSVAITKVPTVTITGTSNPSSANKMVDASSGTVQLTYANGATRNVSASTVTYTTDGAIADTSYSKSITLTATYQKNSSSTKLTATAKITVYNPAVSMKQSTVPTVDATDYNTKGIDVTSAFSNAFTVTYANTKTKTVTHSMASTGSKIFVANITDASASATRTTAAAGTDMSGAAALTFQFVENGVTVQCNGSIKVINNVSSFSEKSVTASAYTNTTVTPSGSVTVTLKNNKTTTITPTWGAIPNITTATDVAQAQTSSVSYSWNGSKTANVPCKVYNPATSIARYTDPTDYTIANTNAITAAQIKSNGAGLVKATLTNGLTVNVTPDSFTASGVQITDNTQIKSFEITANYKSSGGSNQTCKVYVVLKNPIVSHTFDANPDGKVLTTSAIAVTGGGGTLKLANGKTIVATITWSSNLYPSGKTTSGTATGETSGSCTVSGTISGSGATTTRYTDGKSVNTSTSSYSKALEATQTWTNIPKSISNATGTATAGASSCSSISATGTVTYENGGQASRALSVTGTVSTITNTDYQVVRKGVACTYTANGKTVTGTCSITVSNYMKSYAVSNVTISLMELDATAWTAVIKGTVTLTNNKTIANVAATSLTAGTDNIGSLSTIKVAGTNNNQISVTYGGDMASFKITGNKATLSSYYGRTKSATFDIFVDNFPDFIVYTSVQDRSEDMGDFELIGGEAYAIEAPTTAPTSSKPAPVFYFLEGNTKETGYATNRTVTYYAPNTAKQTQYYWSVGSYYPVLEYPNGHQVLLNKSDVTLGSYLQHLKSSPYKCGGSCNCANSYEWQQFKYTLPTSKVAGNTPTTTSWSKKYYCIPMTTVIERYYTDSDMKYNGGSDDNKDISAEKMDITLVGYAVWGNGTIAETGDTVVYEPTASDYIASAYSKNSMNGSYYIDSTSDKVVWRYGLRNVSSDWNCYAWDGTTFSYIGDNKSLSDSSYGYYDFYQSAVARSSLAGGWGGWLSDYDPDNSPTKYFAVLLPHGLTIGDAYYTTRYLTKSFSTEMCTMFYPHLWICSW